MADNVTIRQVSIDINKLFNLCESETTVNALRKQLYGITEGAYRRRSDELIIIGSIDLTEEDI